MLVNIHKLYFVPLIIFGWNTVQALEAWTLKRLANTAWAHNLSLTEENTAPEFIVQSIIK